MKIPYFPGCTLKTNARNFEVSAIEVSKKLGIEFVELAKWNCCGTVTSLADDNLMHHLAPIRDLIRVEEMNDSGEVDNEYRLVCLCTMCYNVLKRSDLRIKQRPDEFKKINDFMYLEKDYEGKTEVIHFLELLKDLDFSLVEKQVQQKLTDLKVAPYYGCLMLRPKEIGIDDPENPTIHGDLLRAIGTEVIDFSFKTRCCGSYQTVRDKYTVAGMTYDIITKARQNGAEMITTSCPLCLFNLADRQKEVMEKYPDFEPMPILYFTQLMALAFGLEEKYSGFEDNYIDPRPLLRKKGLLK